MNIEELQEKFEQLASTMDWIKTKIVELQEEKGIAPIKAPYEVEVPTDIDEYYSVDEYGEADYLDYFSSNYGESCYIRGLAFKTEEEIKKYDKERILLFKLHKWAEEHNGGWKPNWENRETKYHITYEVEQEFFNIEYCVCYQQFSKLPYFKTEKIAKKFIEEFGEEIKEVLC